LKLRGLLCVLDVQRHRPDRVPLLNVYRCRDCGASADTELELLGDRADDRPAGHLRPGRPAGYVRAGERPRAFVRDDRYRAAV
jgi:hypothetical protein